MYQSIIQGLSGGRRDLRCCAKLCKQKSTIPFSIFDGRLGPLTLTFVRSAYFMHCSALARSSLRRCLMDLMNIINEHAIFMHLCSLVAVFVVRLSVSNPAVNPRDLPRPYGHQSVTCPLKKRRKKKTIIESDMLKHSSKSRQFREEAKCDSGLHPRMGNA